MPVRAGYNERERLLQRAAFGPRSVECEKGPIHRHFWHSTLLRVRPCCRQCRRVWGPEIRLGGTSCKCHLSLPHWGEGYCVAAIRQALSALDPRDHSDDD